MKGIILCPLHISFLTCVTGTCVAEYGSRSFILIAMSYTIIKIKLGTHVSKMERYKEGCRMGKRNSKIKICLKAAMMKSIS